MQPEQPFWPPLAVAGEFRRYLTHFRVSDLQKHSSHHQLVNVVLPIRQVVVPDYCFAFYFILMKLNICEMRNWEEGLHACMRWRDFDYLERING